MKESAEPAPSPLQLDIANRIADLISRGRFEPGEHLAEQSLAAEFGVSRSPVRAALKILARHGYVQARANAGVSVSDVLPETRPGIFRAAGKTSDDVYRQILSDRATGVLGDVLTQMDLISRYQVSRGVLLRALLRANREGLVARRKGHGWVFLPALDSAEAKAESYRFRLIVECGGLREPGFRIDPDGLAEVRQAHEHFQRLPSAEQTSGLFYEMNARFHELLAEFSGNRFIVEAVRHQNQLRRLEEYRRHEQGPSKPSGQCREHLDIIAALEAGDVELAALLLHRHLVRSSRF